MVGVCLPLDQALLPNLFRFQFLSFISFSLFCPWLEASSIDGVYVLTFSMAIWAALVVFIASLPISLASGTRNLGPRDDAPSKSNFLRRSSAAGTSSNPRMLPVDPEFDASILQQLWLETIFTSTEGKCHSWMLVKAHSP